MGKCKLFVLSLLAVLCVLLLAAGALYMYFGSDPPIAQLYTCDTEDYLELSPYMRRLLNTKYRHLLPENIPKDCSTIYQYSYRCDFDGRLYFFIYLRLDFQSSDAYRAELENIESRLSNSNWKKSGNKSYCIRNAQGLDNFTGSPQKVYTGFSAAFIEADDEADSLSFLITEQYSSDNELPENVREMLLRLAVVQQED